MQEVRINHIKIKNYRSFGEEQIFVFPNKDYKKPVAIVGYNNSGKTNLINAIKYGLFEAVREDTFELKDFHNCNWSNTPSIKLGFSTIGLGDSKICDNTEYLNTINIFTKDERIISVNDGCNASAFNGKEISKKWSIKQNLPIFYINFHSIKDQIITKKTSWGNLTSFLAKHIKKLIDLDKIMQLKKIDFKTEINEATQKVRKNSKLNEFISKIKINYSENLRKNNCEIDFSLPDYEDIFLQMIFKIGLNGDNTKLIPIDHFGDGYISMFVMAVIQAIAESNTEDKCLFLFEEPESFLHENHQEYFYKAVLCNLSERGHQVIYTTHSDKMVDIFDTKGIIRIEFNEKNKQTEKKYNNVGEFSPINKISQNNPELITIDDYNNFIKYIEPNLNKILFSRKVILVEGANDILVYKYLIEKHTENIKGKKYAETYLNFLNIAIIVHQGKSTAWLLIDLCKHFELEYFAINDLDLNDNSIIEVLSEIKTEVDLKSSSIYTLMQDDIINKEKGKTKKQKLTVNWKLINSAGIDKIHFNTPKLESVLGYDSEDKDSFKIWNKIKNLKMPFSETFFPQSLQDFLEFYNLRQVESISTFEDVIELGMEDLPF